MYIRTILLGATAMLAIGGSAPAKSPSQAMADEMYFASLIDDASIRAGVVKWVAFRAADADAGAVPLQDLNRIFVVVDPERTNRDAVIDAFAGHCQRSGRGGAHLSYDVPGAAPRKSDAKVWSDTAFFLKCDR